MASAYNKKKTINIKCNQLTSDFPIIITKRQKKVGEAIKDKVGFIIEMWETQVTKQSQNGGFLDALAGLITKFIPKIIAPLATGALTSVSNVAMKKIIGQGMILMYLIIRRSI